MSQWVGGPKQIEADQGTKSIHGQGEPGINERMLQEGANPLGHQKSQKNQPAHKRCRDGAKRIQLEEHQIAIGPGQPANKKVDDTGRGW